MRLRHKRSGMRQGMAIPLVVVMVGIISAMGIGLFFYARGTHRQATRAALATSAEYVCEAACEEGFWLAQAAINNPNATGDPNLAQLYDIIRQPVNMDTPIEIPFTPSLTIQHLQSGPYSELAADFPADSFVCTIKVQFDPGPFSGTLPCEYGGDIIVESAIEPGWAGGAAIYRRVRVKRRFKTVLITPPHPFDKAALNIIHADFINGQSKQALDADILTPTNQAITQHGVLVTTAKMMVNKIKSSCCSRCYGCAGMSNIQTFFAASIPGDAKINTATFFRNDSCLISKVDEFDEVEHINYEDILRDKWPPLNTAEQVLLVTITALNLTLTVKGTALIASLNCPTCDKMITTGQGMLSNPYTAAAGQAMITAGQTAKTAHMALEKFVNYTSLADQIAIGSSKITLDGLIVGQLFCALDQAGKGNWGAALGEGLGLAMDYVTSGALNKVSAPQQNQGYIQNCSAVGEDGKVITNADGSVKMMDGAEAIKDSDGNITGYTYNGAQYDQSGNLLPQESGLVETTIKNPDGSTSTVWTKAGQTTGNGTGFTQEGAKKAYDQARDNSLTKAGITKDANGNLVKPDGMTDEAFNTAKENAQKAGGNAMQNYVKNTTGGGNSGWGGMNAQQWGNTALTVGSGLASVYQSATGVDPAKCGNGHEGLSSMGLIKGKVGSHRNYYLMEFDNSTSQLSIYRQLFADCYGAPMWQKRCVLYMQEQSQFDEVYNKYKDKGFCGVVYFDSPAPLELDFSGFKGKLVVFATMGVNVNNMTVEDRNRDSVTLVTPGDITLNTSNVEASLNCIGGDNSWMTGGMTGGGNNGVAPVGGYGSYGNNTNGFGNMNFNNPASFGMGSGIVFNSTPNVFGNIVLNHYTTFDQTDHGSNERALKGNIELNKRLNMIGDDGFSVKPSHLRTFITPAPTDVEVCMVPSGAAGNPFGGGGSGNYWNSW